MNFASQGQEDRQAGMEAGARLPFHAVLCLLAQRAGSHLVSGREEFDTEAYAEVGYCCALRP